MSEPIAFDTHRFVKRLTENGFTEAQAEALADEQVNLLNSNLATKQNLLELGAATKQDLLEVKGDLERQMAKMERQLVELKGDLEQRLAKMERQLLELKGDLERKIIETKNDLLKWMIGAVIAQTGVIVGLVVGLT